MPDEKTDQMERLIAAIDRQTAALERVAAGLETMNAPFRSASCYQAPLRELLWPVSVPS